MLADEPSRRLRVLIATNRTSYRLVSYGMIVDFEDTVAEHSDADLVSVPLPSLRAKVAALRHGRRLSRVTAPRRGYDVCLLVAMAPQWLPSLEYIRDLRAIASRVVVYLFDSWVSDLDVVRRHHAAWSLVDDVFVSFPHAVAAYSRELDCRIHYLPQAIDPRWFHARREERPIDVLSIGRRLEPVHKRLLELADQRDWFYYYQTVRAPQAIDLRENQRLLGRLCQSSRVHVSWSVDSTTQRRAEDGSAITARWFEAAASGAVVIGREPRSEEFRRLFPYDDFVHEIAPEVPETIESVATVALSSSDRTQRRELAEHVRRAHSWGKRWSEIVQACDL